MPIPDHDDNHLTDHDGYRPVRSKHHHHCSCSDDDLNLLDYFDDECEHDHNITPACRQHHYNINDVTRDPDDYLFNGGP